MLWVTEEGGAGSTWQGRRAHGEPNIEARSVHQEGFTEDSWWGWVAGGFWAEEITCMKAEMCECMKHVQEAPGTLQGVD